MADDTPVDDTVDDTPANYDQPEVVPKRVRFYNGQYLRDQDFIDEQKFHLDRERRQSMLLRLTGVCSGLTVAKNGTFKATVAGGTAVDALGRHLVLAAADTDLPLPSGFANQQNIEVRLAYREAATDLAQTGGESHRRWDESPRIVVRAPDGTDVVVPDDAPRTLDGPTVLLATLAVAENGDVTVDAGVAQRSSLSVSGAIGVGATDPGSDVQLGDFDQRDRHLTFTMAGGNRQRGGIRLWAGEENQGYSLEYDDRASAPPGLHVRTHDQNPAGTTRLFVGRNGDIGIGTTAPANAEQVGRVVDIVSTSGAKLAVRGAQVDGGVLAHETGVYGARPGMIVGTATPSPLTFVTNSAARLSISSAGDVAIGAPAAAGTGGWGRVVDVLGAGSAKLAVRTTQVEARLQANDQVSFGAPAGMVVGTSTAHPLSFVTSSVARLTIAADGAVAIGGAPSSARLAVTASDSHLQLRRDANETTAGSQLFLELYQNDTSTPPMAPVYPNIRFHHSRRFWHRIEARTNGFHLKTGDLKVDEYSGLKAKNVDVTELTIGSVTIGEAELAVLKKLAAGELKFRILNTGVNRYIAVGGDFSSLTKYVFAYAPTIAFGNQVWQLTNPG